MSSTSVLSTLVATCTRRVLIFLGLWVAFIFFGAAYFTHSAGGEAGGYAWIGGIFATPLVLILFILMDRFFWSHPARPDFQWARLTVFSVVIMSTSHFWIFLTLRLLNNLDSVWPRS